MRSRSLRCCRTSSAPSSATPRGGQFNTVSAAAPRACTASLYEYLQNRNLNAIDQAVQAAGDPDAEAALRSEPPRRRRSAVRSRRTSCSTTASTNTIRWARPPRPPADLLRPTAAGYATSSRMPAFRPRTSDILKQYLPAAATQAKTTRSTGSAIPLGILPIRRPTITNTYIWLVSVDYNISDGTSFAGATWTTRFVDRYQLPNLPVFFYPGRPLAPRLESSEFHTFNPNLTNEFRAGVQPVQRQHRRAGLQIPGPGRLPEHPDSRTISMCRSDPTPTGPGDHSEHLPDQRQRELDKGPARFQVRFRRPRTLIAASTFIQRVRGDYDYNTWSVPAGQGAGCPGAAQRGRQAVFGQQYRPLLASPTTTGRSTAI